MTASPILDHLAVADPALCRAMKVLSPEQRRYFCAAYVYERSLGRCHELQEPIFEQFEAGALTREKAEALLIDIEWQCKIHQNKVLFAVCERELIEWGLAMLQELDPDADFTLMQQALFGVAPGLKKKFIDLAMKMPA